MFLMFILGFLLIHTAWTGITYGHFCVDVSFVNDYNSNVRQRVKFLDSLRKNEI